MHWLAHSIIILYFVFLLLSTFIKKWQAGQEQDYLLAGRKLTLFPFVATLVSTTYGWIVGIGELYYTYGISAWLFLSLPYLLFSLLFAFVYSKRARQDRFSTLPDLLHFHYGRKVASLGALLFMLLSSPAMYLLMTAQVLHFVWGWDMLSCILFSGVFSGLYLLKGGFKALVKLDIVQFILMFFGFAVMLLALWYKYGTAPLSQLPATYKQFDGTYSWLYIFSWFLFAAVVLIDPNYYQRIYATDRAETAKRGLIISVLFWTFFDFLTAASALYALALLPEVGDKSQVYLLLGQQSLPAWVIGFFFTGILATIISTTNGFLFTSALSLSKDILQRNQLFTGLHVEQLTRYTLVLIAVLNTLICIWYKDSSVVDLFFDIAPYVTAGLLLPVLSAYRKSIRLSSQEVWIQLLCSVAITAFFKYYRQGKEGIWTELNEVYFGLAFSLFYQGFLLIVKRRT